MFKNYFKTAFRNLARNKVYSFINIAGLSIGLTCAMLIILYVKDEVSFDRFHKKVNNIYRIVSTEKVNGHENYNAYTGYLQGPRFTQHVPGIKSFVRIEGNMGDVKNGTEVYSQDFLRVDSSFFSVFSFPLIDGDPKTCLAEPRSIVLSEDAAKKQFGTTKAVGKIVMLKEDSTFVPYKVTAVTKRCPQNSSIQFTVLLPFKESPADAVNNENWFRFFINTFVVLDDNARKQSVEKQMQSYYATDAKSSLDALVKKFGANTGISMDNYFLQPYLDMHMSTTLRADNGLSNASNPMYAYILSGIALFVLLIACINFVNLTVARSVKRAKEIGIRKVIGGDRKKLIVQFLGESFFLCTIAFVLAVVLAQTLLPVFNSLSNKALSIAYLIDPVLVAGYITLFIATGLLAGLYPALVLSSYNPVQTLYSRFQIAGKNYLQKSLVVLQFTLASFLIIATLTIYKQFSFLTTEKLGYDDNNLIVVNKPNLTHTDAEIFKHELMKNPHIAGVGLTRMGWQQTSARNSIDSAINFKYETVDETYLPLLKIPLVQGRNFSKTFSADASQSVIVNESFVKAAHWKNPIGQTVNFWYWNNEIYHVIGVVKDYHFAPITQTILPQLFTIKNANLYSSYYIKIKPGTETESLKWIQKKFTQFYPLTPYAYSFKTDENLKAYEAIAKWKQILLFGASLTIFISCIGLFGLSVLSAEKRIKEIGIRKVLGASVKNIVTTLSTDFIKLVIIALIIASPLAYLAANRWLQNFPYRISITAGMFTTSALLVVCIALFTISFQAVKAAIANPVKSLKTE